MRQRVVSPSLREEAIPTHTRTTGLAIKETPFGMQGQARQNGQGARRAARHEGHGVPLGPKREAKGRQTEGLTAISASPVGRRRQREAEDGLRREKERGRQVRQQNRSREGPLSPKVVQGRCVCGRGPSVLEITGLPSWSVGPPWAQRPCRPVATLAIL